MNIKSKKPSKQRKKLYKGALHTRRKLLVAPVSKEIKENINKSKLVVRKGDKVKILVGNNKGKTGVVQRVDYDKAKVFIKGFSRTNSRSQERLIPFVASNLIIIDALLDDNKRIKNVATKTSKKKPNKKVK
jgi:large subunit ribosomal protein L24